MNVARLVLAEIVGRPLNFALSVLVVIVACVLFIAGPTLLNGYAADTRRQLESLQQGTDAELEKMQIETNRQLAEMDAKTKRIMRDLGVNLRIVHRDTKMGNLYTDFVAIDFPEDYVQTLASAPQLETIVHLIATLQQRIKWNGRTALLVGMLPVLTSSQKNAEKQHMAQPVEPGRKVADGVIFQQNTGQASKADQHRQRDDQGGQVYTGDPKTVECASKKADQ